ncbi:MAG TPA: DUF5996 family protein [Terriglobales bacterium]|jgi:hypothetical protein|nr:DUF5996 family protein [Terriglobales bacterium]
MPSPVHSLDSPDAWPALPFASWKETWATLHMWLQMVGKVRLGLTPLVNHWWNVALYLSPRGLTTSAMPCGERALEIEFDFLDHQLLLRASDGAARRIALAPRSVADFYREFMAALKSMGVQVKIWAMPVEIPDPIPFERDTVHASYDPQAAHSFWRILLSSEEVLDQFRARFLGKCSPVHFFWGGCDLAVTRFNGRRAPERQDPDPILRKIMREAYSHEVLSAGWWPGSLQFPDPAFYAYAAPEPAGFAQQSVRPPQAGYNKELGEFILLYEDMRRAPSPSAALLEFLESTYEAGATTGRWDRAALERPAGAA